MWHRKNLFWKIFSLQYQCGGFVNNSDSILCQFLGLQNSPIYRAQTNLTASRNFPSRTRFWNVQWRCSLVWILRAFPKYPVDALNVSFEGFFKRPTIPAVKSKQYKRSNVFIIINALGALKYNWLKNDHSLRVLLLSSYTVKLHRKGYKKYSPNFFGRYIVMLGWHIDEFFQPSLPPTVLYYSAIQMDSWIFLYSIMVDPKEHVVGSYEVDFQEVSHTRLEGGFSGINVGVWPRLGRANWDLFQGWVHQEFLVAEWGRGAIVLDIWGWFGFGVVKIRNFDIVGVSEKHHWSGNGVDFFFWYLVNYFQFDRMSCKVRCVGQARGRFFGRIDIFRVAFASSKTGRQRDITVRVGGWYGWHVLPSVGCAWIGFLLPLSVDSIVSVSGAAVSVSSWAAWAVSALADKSGHSSLSVRALGENSGIYGWKTTGGMAWQRIGAASWASLVFSFTLDVSLKAVGDCVFPPGGGVRLGPLLRQFSSRQPLI